MQEKGCIMGVVLEEKAVLGDLSGSLGEPCDSKQFPLE